MKKYRNVSFVAGFLVVICYLSFTLLAFSLYPLPFSPMRNWLSDLGNVDLNPHGAILYNIGIITTAILLLLFFLGLSGIKMNDKRVQNIMLRLTQTFGIFGSFCMILSAIFPINFFEVHSFWSSSLFIMLATGFVFSAAAMRYHQRFPKWLFIIGIATAPIVILWSFFKSVYVLEWITLLIFLSYVSLLGIETKRV